MISAQTICPFLPPAVLLRLKMSYSVRLKSFFAFPSLPFLSLFRFVTLSAVAWWGTAKARADPDGFGRTEEQMQSQSSLKKEKWSGCCDCKRGSKRASQTAQRDGEILFCTYYESDGGWRSVCVCVNRVAVQQD